MGYQLFEFENLEDCHKALTERFKEFFNTALKKHHQVSIAFSGGRSPISLLQKLSVLDLKWHECSISLVDERIIDTSHDDSNTKLLHDYLLQNNALKASFIPLLPKKISSDTNALFHFTNQHFKQPHLAILGMGTDGHTASLFPETSAFLNEEKENIVLVKPANAPYERLSMSVNALENCEKLFLSISGVEKREVLEKALKESAPYSLPIARILHSQKVTTEVFYAKN
ncbi:6-phosphogluconolactonase [Helicobacter pylori]|uniref:6-phosphogluconolactonase n=1 Tax=Helicobacter pylori TaxID=210 RepID=UPI000BE90E6C|nr:6-phosphogluconolactonase [Helicobacter pylori]PDX42816.1 6-phosphogluconolactonase [Helicobacter pylori]